ncbi:MAG TPA: hypothetical protein VIF57_21545 [Polyangia bacterium]
MRRGPLARAGLLVGAGALALSGLSTLACRREERARPACLALAGPSAPVGFGGTFTITARLTCPDLHGGRIVWRQLTGVPLAALSTARDGFELTARMPPLGGDGARGVPWGVVPLSPATRGEIALVARWADDTAGGAELTAEFHVTAAPRSRGLPNTPVGARVYLGGQGWRLTARPADSHAALDLIGGVASLLPDVAGDWRLADAGGRALALRAARYDETPLDCGRSDCHRAIADAAAASPMTGVLARLMGARPPGGDYPACALACHATGEPGTPDGGFAHVVSELGAAGDLRRPWAELPRDLRRLGGVGCLACHGPAAIPEAAARWSVLRADVCAVCHDAPPRYGHVTAWRTTAMARADQDPRARSERACARCHTTWGFLAAVATPERGPVDRRPPEDVGAIGITCSACHAVHDAKRPGAAHLLRETPVPALLAGAAPSVCLGCHAPDVADARPTASAAALWLGRGGVDPASGAPLTGAPLHAGVAGGCVGCHRAGPDNLERGAGHGFRAPPSVCTACHPAAPSAAGDVQARARRLWHALTGRDAAGPAHAGGADAVASDRRTPLGRATWDLLLVLEDRAAGAHNARYANALLDAAASVIEGEKR